MKISDEVNLILKEAAQNNLSFFLEDGKVKFRLNRDIAISKSLIDRIRDHKDEIAELVYFQQDQAKRIAFNSESARLSTDRPARIPLSYSQEQLWFIDRMEGSSHYHIRLSFRLKGVVGEVALKRALSTIVERHEVLRTVIEEEDGIPCQVIKSVKGWEPIMVTASMSAGKKDRVRKEFERPFDLTRDYMFRCCLVEESSHSHILMMCIHHIAFDGLSEAILMREFSELYSCYNSGQRVTMEQLPFQYADYAIWQREYLRGQIFERKLSYWREELSGVAALSLPLDKPRSTQLSKPGDQIYFEVEGSIYRSLKALCVQEGVTPFMALLATYAILLSRYSGQSDICIGTPVANRESPDLDSLIGFFINTLVLRIRIESEGSFLSCLNSVRDTVLNGFEHQEVPFEKVVEATTNERQMGVHPLFQVMFLLQQVEGSQEILALDGLEVNWLSNKVSTTKFDLTMSLHDHGDKLGGIFEYNSSLFSKKKVNQMMSHYLVLLRSVVTQPAKALKDLKMLSEREERQLLEEFSGRKEDYPGTETVVSLFESQAQATPGSIAVVYEDQELTYSELSYRSNQLANYLVSCGVQKEELISICLERSIEVVIGILGILKAGCAYVPIDPMHPKERISYMLTDIKAKQVLTSKESRDRLPEELKLNIVELDNKKSLFKSCSSQSPKTVVAPEQLAYVIYTSGSTGRPKGVMIEHRNITSLIFGLNVVQFSQNDNLLATGSISFDAATFEYWSTLLNGGKLVFSSREILMDYRRLKRFVEVNRITKMWFTSSWCNQLIDIDIEIFKTLQAIIVGGEQLSYSHIKRLQSRFPKLKIVNGYGPTENTTFSTFYVFEGEFPDEKVPIGRPLDNRMAFILGQNGELLPLGTSGELCLSGDGLGRGYLNDPGLTNKKFIIHRLRENGKLLRLYRTGDLAEWLPDGNIRFIGRMDDQVKIRGHRVELGEIEWVLNRAEFVQQGIILITDNSKGKVLVAVVVLKKGFDIDYLREYMKSNLPDYMVPSKFISVSSIPLTRNGKADRTYLLKKLTSDLEYKEYIPAQTKLQQQIIGIWKDILGKNRVGIEDDFFESGGNSIILLQLVHRLRKLNINVQLTELMSFTTIRAFTDHLSKGYRRQRIQADMSDHVIRLNHSRRSHMVFIIPGAGGYSEGYDMLAKGLEEKYQVFGIQMLGTLDGEEPSRSIHEMAKYNIELIKRVQPGPPYRFIAHSFGCIVLHEMIKILEGLNERVEFGILLDMNLDEDYSKGYDISSMPNVVYSLLEENGFGDHLDLQWIQLIKKQLVKVDTQEKALEIISKFFSDKLENFAEFNYVFKIVKLNLVNTRLRLHSKKRIESPMVLVKARDQNHNDLTGALGWHKYANNLEIITCPGDHQTMIKNPNAEVLAHQIRQIEKSNS